MELTIKELLASREALGILGNAKGLSSIIAYKISKNLKSVNNELGIYEETRAKIAKDKANKDEKGEAIIKEENGSEVYDISPENLLIVNEEIKKLQEEKTEVDIKKISLEDISNVGLSAFELETIEFMLDVKE